MNKTQKFPKDISAIFDNAQNIAKAVRADLQKEKTPRLKAVSYTHLTLPTILRV